MVVADVAGVEKLITIEVALIAVVAAVAIAAAVVAMVVTVVVVGVQCNIVSTRRQSEAAGKTAKMMITTPNPEPETLRSELHDGRLGSDHGTCQVLGGSPPCKPCALKPPPILNPRARMWICRFGFGA